MAKITNEKMFMDWFSKNLIKVLSPDSKVKRLSDRSSSGYPDLIIITPSNGVVAVELKFIKHEPSPGKSPFSHKLSSLQERFLDDWGKSCGGKSFMVTGVLARGSSEDRIIVTSHNRLGELNLRGCCSMNELGLVSDVFFIDIGADIAALNDPFYEEECCNLRALLLGM